MLSLGAGVVEVRQRVAAAPPHSLVMLLATNGGSGRLGCLPRLAPSTSVMGVALKLAQVIAESSVAIETTGLTLSTSALGAASTTGLLPPVGATGGMSMRHGFAVTVAIWPVWVTSASSSSVDGASASTRQEAPEQSG